MKVAVVGDIIERARHFLFARAGHNFKALEYYLGP